MRWQGLKAVRWIALAGWLFCGSRDVSARTWVPQQCVLNLRIIDGAKEQWALEKKQAETAVADAEALTPYIHMGFFPACPDGGIYTIGSVAEDARCSIAGHTVAEIERLRQKANRKNAI